jgi:hypothetical protein
MRRIPRGVDEVKTKTGQTPARAFIPRGARWGRNRSAKLTPSLA